MATTTSKINKIGSNYYQTSVTTNSDGSLKSITYRTDAKGSTQVPVFSRTTTPNGNGGFANKDSFESGASLNEKVAFSNPNSQERQVYSQQVKSQNPYGTGATAAQKEQVNNSAGKPNQATNNPQSGDNQQQGEGAATDAQNEAINRDIGTTGKGYRENFSTSLVFPEKLKSEQQDVIKFKMVKFRPRSISNTQGGALNPVGNRQGNQTVIGTVVLPIPSGISDANTVNWGSDELDPFKAMGVDIAQTAIVQGIGAGVESAGAAAQNIANNSGDAGSAIANKFVEAATGTQNLLSRTKGAIVNPNMELLFLGPQLRPFNFTFKLSARNETESKIIRTIIRFFKQGMSPIKTEANLFLKAPHTFQIEYLNRNKQHSYLNKFKECALVSFAVDYTPEGQYATFHTGAMVSYQITMQFQELEPVFNNDYGEGVGSTGYDSEIGY